jgi:hypothetical protein
MFPRRLVPWAGANSVHHQFLLEHQLARQEGHFGQSVGCDHAGMADAHAAAARQFDKPIEVYRGPYEYSVPGQSRDFTPQNEPDQPEP